MKVHLSAATTKDASIAITGSKSETNRLLILQALYPNISIENCSLSDDSRVLQKALLTKKGVVDVHHAGTAMRFLTAYFSITEGASVTLTGSDRMLERPIGMLVSALNDLGADISYEGQNGYPPLKIQGKRITKDTTSLKATISSQFISALLLVAPALPNGLRLELLGELTSKPYIDMTLSLLARLGVDYRFKNSIIEISNAKSVGETTIVVESDWSSASYFYSMIALSRDMEITLSSFKTESLQGDSALVSLYDSLGVTTRFNSETHSIILQKNKNKLPKVYRAHLVDTPDIAQTIAVTCFGLGIGCKLTGLHTLKIKETDRLQALKIEIEKLGGRVLITDNSLELLSSNEIKENIAINTYNDHRMAMAFAPLALKVPIVINDSNVVTKSFPSFWQTMHQIGIEVTKM